jgi:hypothetical protein
VQELGHRTQGHHGADKANRRRGAEEQVGDGQGTQRDKGGTDDGQGPFRVNLISSHCRIQVGMQGSHHTFPMYGRERETIIQHLLI